MPLFHMYRKKLLLPLLTIVGFGLAGTGLYMASKAATNQTTAIEAEAGTMADQVELSTDASASQNQAVTFKTAVSAGKITHGEQISAASVGPTALGVAKSQLQNVTPNERISTYPGNSFPSWIPKTAYVYNNDANNHGGIVPAGGMTIDGFYVPAGTWVSQFQNYDKPLTLEGSCNGAGTAWPGIVFRGVRFRGASPAPGFLNENNSCGTIGGRVWVTYSDIGANGAADAQYHEVGISMRSAPLTAYRNYISYVTTGIQVNSNNSNVLENLIEKVTLYYNNAPPPNESTGKHLNGFTTNGGMTNIRIERNKIILQTPDDAGRLINQTDAISFFQDFGAFPGTGMNDNGTRGYQVLDNYVGGGGFTLYAGMNTGKAASSVQHFTLAGNKVTTQWWPKGGAFGPITAEPSWGSYGNSKSNNVWADGSRVGAPIN